ncbi:hypothetical protein [Prochlorococcus marinus]|nr:hypothetical protein [Prochlorococcus marinus]
MQSDRHWLSPVSDTDRFAQRPALGPAAVMTGGSRSHSDIAAHPSM